MDDAAQGITEVVRARDLLHSAHQQRFLYRALSLPSPAFSHIPLLLSADGRRLSKRDKDMDMLYLRSRFSREELIGLIMHLARFTEQYEPLSLDDALKLFDWSHLPRADISVRTDLFSI